MTKIKKFSLTSLVLIGISTITIPSLLTGPAQLIPPIVNTAEQVSEKNSHSVIPLTTLKVMTLNLAHGRKDGWHQIFQSPATIKSNLTEIATVLRREQPQVVALQEADQPSFWSGNFNHVHYLAQQPPYNYAIQGEHVKRFGLTYGTALLSQLPLINPLSITFTYTPPTPAKGFVMTTLRDPGINVVSLHLDFSRASVRQRQVEEMVKHLKPLTLPLIIMGDFNCEWAQEHTLPWLTAQLQLHAYQPESTGLKTFSTSRIDWILISSELEFMEYKVLPEILSDHFGIVAQLNVKNEKSK